MNLPLIAPAQYGPTSRDARRMAMESCPEVRPRSRHLLSRVHCEEDVKARTSMRALPKVKNVSKYVQRYPLVMLVGEIFGEGEDWTSKQDILGRN